MLNLPTHVYLSTTPGLHARKLPSSSLPPWGSETQIVAISTVTIDARPGQLKYCRYFKRRENKETVFVALI